MNNIDYFISCFNSKSAAEKKLIHLNNSIEELRSKSKISVHHAKWSDTLVLKINDKNEIRARRESVNGDCGTIRINDAKTGLCICWDAWGPEPLWRDDDSVYSIDNVDRGDIFKASTTFFENKNDVQFDTTKNIAVLCSEDSKIPKKENINYFEKWTVAELKEECRLKTPAFAKSNYAEHKISFDEIYITQLSLLSSMAIAKYLDMEYVLIFNEQEQNIPEFKNLKFDGKFEMIENTDFINPHKWEYFILTRDAFLFIIEVMQYDLTENYTVFDVMSKINQLKR